MPISKYIRTNACIEIRTYTNMKIRINEAPPNVPHLGVGAKFHTKSRTHATYSSDWGSGTTIDRCIISKERKSVIGENYYSTEFRELLVKNYIYIQNYIKYSSTIKCLKYSIRYLQSLT